MVTGLQDHTAAMETGMVAEIPFQFKPSMAKCF